VPQAQRSGCSMILLLPVPYLEVVFLFSCFTFLCFMDTRVTTFNVEKTDGDQLI